MGYCDEFVLFLFERFLDLVELRTVADRCFELRRFDAVRFEAIRKAVGEVAGVQDEDFVSGLREVGGDLVPAQCSRARNDEGLGGGVGGLEELAQHGQGFAEAVHEGLADVGFAVVRHAAQDFVVELDGAWDEQGRVGGLGRHLGCAGWWVRDALPFFLQ